MAGAPAIGICEAQYIVNLTRDAIDEGHTLLVGGSTQNTAAFRPSAQLDTTAMPIRRPLFRRGAA